MKQYLWCLSEERTWNSFKDISSYFFKEGKRMKESTKWPRWTWESKLRFNSQSPGRNQDPLLFFFLIRNMPQVAFSKWCKSSVADRGLKRKCKYVSFQRAGKSAAYNSGFCVSCPVRSHLWEGQPPQLQQCNFNSQFFLFHFSHPEPRKY